LLQPNSETLTTIKRLLSPLGIPGVSYDTALDCSGFFAAFCLSALAIASDYEKQFTDGKYEFENGAVRFSGGGPYPVQLLASSGSTIFKDWPGPPGAPPPSSGSGAANSLQMRIFKNGANQGQCGKSFLGKANDLFFIYNRDLSLTIDIVEKKFHIYLNSNKVIDFISTGAITSSTDLGGACVVLYDTGVELGETRPGNLMLHAASGQVIRSALPASPFGIRELAASLALFYFPNGTEAPATRDGIP
jgi:hypothetical protein